MQKGKILFLIALFVIAILLSPTSSGLFTGLQKTAESGDVKLVSISAGIQKDLETKQSPALDYAKDYLDYLAEIMTDYAEGRANYTRNYTSYLLNYTDGTLQRASALLPSFLPPWISNLSLSKWEIFEIEAGSGEENSIYAPNSSTVYVAYKKINRSYTIDRFSDPAEVRLAKSTDGGKTWDIKTIDSTFQMIFPVVKAGSIVVTGTLTEHGISIDGSGDVVYVSYLVTLRDSNSGYRLKVAKSTDGGQTWQSEFVPFPAGVYGGSYNSIMVADPNTVYITFRGATDIDINSESLYVAKTTDGGSTWDVKNIDREASAAYNSLDASDADNVFNSYYNLRAGHTDLNFIKTSDGGISWDKSVVDHRTSCWIGSDNSLRAVNNQVLYIAYDQFCSPFQVKFARSFDGGNYWDLKIIDTDYLGSVDAPGSGVGIGALDENNVYVSYLKGEMPMIMVAKTKDRGESWTYDFVPDRSSWHTDFTIAESRVIFVSYQSPGIADPSGKVGKLKLAKTAIP